jgi:hypothetical protein
MKNVGTKAHKCGLYSVKIQENGNHAATVLSIFNHLIF